MSTTTPTLDELRAACTKPEAPANAFRDYGHALRLEAAQLRARSERLDALADAAYRHAALMPQDSAEQVRAILDRR